MDQRDDVWFDEQLLRSVPIGKNIAALFAEIDYLWAAKALAFNSRNRSMRDLAIDRYARDMIKDKWLLTCQPIIFTASRRLGDGQNRLAAVLKAKVRIQSLVIFGISDEAMLALDQGMSRTVADAHRLAGETSSNSLTAAIGYLWRYSRGAIKRPNVRPTSTESTETLNCWPQIRQSVQFIARHSRSICAMGGVSLHAAAHCLFSEVSPEQAAEFYERLSDGVGLAYGSPINALRNRLMSERGRRKSPAIFAMTVKAWNAYRSGESMKIIKFISDEDVQQIR